MGETNEREKTREQLIEELQRLRQRVAELQEPEDQREWTEEALRESEVKSRALFDSIADPIFVFDQQTERFLDCNKAAIDRYGYTLDELRTMTPYQLHPPDELEVVQKNVEDQAATSPHCYTHITRDGERLQVEIHTRAIEYEGRNAWISVARDITERKQAEEAMRQVEQRYRAVAESAVTGIGIADPEETLTFVNRAFAEMLGYAEEELIGKNLSELTDPQEFASYQARTKEREKGVHSHYETALRRKDGGILSVLVSASPLTASDGSFEGTLAVIADITERKRADEALRGAHEELAEHAEHLERRTAQLQVASEVARHAAAILDVHQLLDETMHLISERFDFYHAGVFLVDEQNEYAVLRATSSEGGRRMLERGHRLRIGEVGIVGYVAATGEPRVALDVGADAVFFDNPDLPDTRSEMALPLSVRGRIIGVLDVQSTEEAAFSKDDVAVLQTLADQLAIAIENARLVERAESQLRELSLLYGEYSAAAWAGLASPAHALGYVYDRVDVVPTEKSPVPALDLALERGETVAIVGPEATEKMLATPLKLRDQVIGALGIQEMGGARAWSPNEIALVEAVGEQVALALENARLFAEAQKSAQQMHALYETSRVLSSSLEEERLIHAVLEAVYHTLGCEHVIISIVDREAETIGIRHGIWHGQFDAFPEWMQAAQYPLDHPDILADVYRSGRTEIIGEWDERFNREVWDRFGHARFLRVFMPIKMRERVIGVVEVGYDKREKGDVGEEEVQMLAAFMDQAAVALENARLFEEARVHAEELAALNELGQALTARLDVEGVLDEAYRGASRLLDTTSFYVALYEPDTDSVSFPLAVEDGQQLKWQSRRMGKGLTEYIIRSRRPLLIRESLPERLAELGVELIGRTALSWLGVPLLVGDRVLGVMAVQSHTAPRSYDEHDRDLLTAIASQTAIALQNAHLYRQAERRAWREGVAREIGAKVTGSVDLRRILQTTARELSHALGASHAVIRVARTGEGADKVKSKTK